MKIFRKLAVLSVVSLVFSGVLQAQKTVMPVPRIQFLSTSGNPLAAGKLHTFEAGTTTPLATFTDSTGGTPNSNPVVLDAGGFASVWLTPGTLYKFQLNNAGDVLQWTEDNVAADNLLALANTWTGLQTFTGGITAGSINLIRYIDGTQYATLSDAVSGFTSGTIVIPTGTHNVAGNLTIPVGVTLRFVDGGLLNISTAITLTIDGLISAPPRKIFTLNGTAATANGSTIVYDVLPEWWGAVGDGLAVSPTDDTIAVQAAIDFAGRGGRLRLSSIYAVTGVDVERVDASSINLQELVITGSGGSQQNTLDTAGERRVGLSAFGNQDYVLRMGNNSGQDMSGNVLEDFQLHGRDKTIAKGLLDVERWADGKITRVSFTKAKGAGIYAPKMQDMVIRDASFVMLGAAANPGAIVFADDTGSSVGSNALFITGSRFEWIDGPVLRLEDANSTAKFVFFHNNKVERGGTNQTYGSLAQNYPVFDFTNSTIDNLRAVSIQNNKIVEADTTNGADTLIRAGASRGITFESNSLGGGTNGRDHSLFKLKSSGGGAAAVTNFVFRNNTFDSFDGVYTGHDVLVENLSTEPIVFEYPIDLRAGTTSRLQNEQFTSIAYASDWGSATVLVTDPVPSTDPALSPAQTVAGILGSVQTTMFVLGFPKSTGAGDYPVTSGLNPGMPRLARVLVRAKKNVAGGTVRFNLRVGAGGTSVCAPSVGTTWDWWECWINLRNFTPSSDGFIIITSDASNGAGDTIYVDAAKIDFKYFYERGTVVPASGTYTRGDILYQINASESEPVGWINTVAGSPGTWRRFGQVATSASADDYTFDSVTTTLANPLEGTLSNTPRWIFKQVDHTDMTAAATADTFTLWTLPANTMIHDVVGTVVTAWEAAVGLSVAVCSVGTAAGGANDLTLDDNFFAAATVYELHDATASGGKGTLLFDATDKFAPFMLVASGDIEIQCDLTGDDHADTNAGQARIYILVSQPLGNTTTEAN